ncbi:hypothetical protein AVEN_53876-1 [Araneus ventricosus]|uniref:Uncharacterized protein n=1 Tax=Araneus ventricosus TaxID=182803 RepID=A0A4Y2U1J7_ARAVE|nr:hypothetical protein AVEN_53876-1 [Araneus ventricosus]
MLPDFLPQFYQGRVCKYATGLGHSRVHFCLPGTDSDSDKEPATVVATNSNQIKLWWMTIIGSPCVEVLGVPLTASEKYSRQL